MSYANGTPFLNLAQTIGTDHRDWFDENEAKLDLDTKMKTLWDGAADTATILSTLQENVGELQTDVTTLEGVVSGHTSTITTINESLVLINTALNALNTQVTNKFDSAGIADPYDATHGTYDIGDVVTYNGQRYVCSTAVTAAEPFDVSKWTAEDVQTVLEKVEGDLYDVPEWSQNGDIQYRKMGSLVELSCRVDSKSDADLLGTLPTEYRPDVIILIASDNDPEHGRVQINNTTGVVSFQNTTGSPINVRIHTMYFTSN